MGTKAEPSAEGLLTARLFELADEFGLATMRFLPGQALDVALCGEVVIAFRPSELAGKTDAEIREAIANRYVIALHHKIMEVRGK